MSKELDEDQAYDLYRKGFSHDSMPSVAKESTEYNYPNWITPQSHVVSTEQKLEELRLEVEYLKRRVEILEGITV